LGGGLGARGRFRTKENSDGSTQNSNFKPGIQTFGYHSRKTGNKLQKRGRPEYANCQSLATTGSPELEELSKKTKGRIYRISVGVPQMGGQWDGGEKTGAPKTKNLKFAELRWPEAGGLLG